MIPLTTNERWSLDFVSDQPTDGRRFRILAIVDDCTRECLGLVVDTSLSGFREARELDRLIIERGKPKMIVSDNGSELTSNTIRAWADQSRVTWHYIAPGKPMQNAFIESFNGRMRDELLNETLFFGLDHATREDRRLGQRLQSSTPAFFARLRDAGGICRQSHRNRRSAAQPRPAPPIVCCYIRALGRIKHRDSSRHYGQVTGNLF